MKIKTVCELTRLSDRAIRHYIDEGLISPSYNENYLGRRSFEFSDSDVDLLNHISTLRKFGFSVSEIRDMIRDSSIIPATVTALQNRKLTELIKEEVLYEKLSQMKLSEIHTVHELASFLSSPVENIPAPEDSSHDHVIRIVLRLIKKILPPVLAVLPLILSLFSLFNGWAFYTYPRFTPFFLVLTLFSLFPTFTFFALIFASKKPQQKKSVRYIIKATALVLCAVLLPLNIIFAGCIFGGMSETDDIRNYRRLDPECIANRDPIYQDLFPTWPHYFTRDDAGNTVYLDASYYYQYSLGWDYTYDIIAEWPLEQEEFDGEVQRVKDLFDKYEYQVFQRGKYTCLVICPPYSPEPFKNVNASYEYNIFAYDTENLRVRYISCGSLDDGYDQPYYLNLDW